MPPRLEIACNDALAGAGFQLVEANIDWDERTRSTGWGRDRDPAAAKWKAIGEAVERYCYTRLPSTISARALDLSHYIHPDALVAYQPWQWAEPGFPFSSFEPTQCRQWLQAQPVAAGMPTLVLADLVCNPRAFDDAYRSHLVTHASTSGCASAQTLDMAILSATLELIERDAFMRHWFAQTPGWQIDLATLPAEARRRFESLADHGCLVGLQQLYLGVHATWLAWAQHRHLHFTCIGSACGLTGDPALDTALNELETLTLARAQGLPPEHIVPTQVRTPGDHAALYATANYFRRADALWRAEPIGLSYADAVRQFNVPSNTLYARLCEFGHAPYWIDLSAEEARNAVEGRTIHTVRVLAAGLIPMTFGYGRLPLGLDAWRRTERHALHPFA